MKKNIRIITVHGTWGNGIWPFNLIYNKLRWHNHDSSFMKSIVNKLDKSIVIEEIINFIWSGKNSVNHRLLASNELAKLIKSKESNATNTSNLIIAHSHGGSVAIEALKIANNNNCAVCFLGTPFISTYKKPINYLIIIPIIMSIFVVTTPLVRNILEYILEYVFIFNKIYRRQIVSISGLILVPLISITSFKLLNYFYVKKIYKMARHLMEEQIHSLDNKFLVISSHNDEAKLLMVIGYIISSIFFTIFLVCGILLYLFISIFLVSLLLSSLGFEYFLELFPFYLTNFEYSLLYSLGRIIVYSLVIVSIFRSIYGIEFSLMPLNIQLSVNTIPLHCNNIDATILKYDNGFIRHSTYLNRECPSVISNWINKTHLS